MSRHEAKEAMKGIIAKVAGYPMEDICEDIHIRDDLLIDSLKQMEIIARIEHHFDIYLDEGKIGCIETLGEFFEIVNSEVAIPS